MTSAKTGLAIIDFGSQYTLLIARRLRELGVYTEIFFPESQPPAMAVEGVILSGGPGSTVDHSGGHSLPKWALELGVPVLGICYGMQLLAREFGAQIEAEDKREYGKGTVILSPESRNDGTSLFLDFEESVDVWMSHGDHVSHPVDGFHVLAFSSDQVCAAIQHREKPYYGLQFHPEVEHTSQGRRILGRFIDLCGTSRDWTSRCAVERAVDEIRDDVGSGRVLVAVSGGVDSTVAAALMSKALGSDRVTPVLVDHGLMRKNEATWVEQELNKIGVPITILERQQLFLQRLQDVTDPEQKRKIIGNTFIEVFEAYAEDHRDDFTHLGQGTLYPDIIESAGASVHAKVIKSHHNVGGLPERLQMCLVEPLKQLFKDEVRQVGEELGLPRKLLYRHPFPGPGLAVRIPGAVTPDRVATLQEVDDIFVGMLHEEGLYDQTWQAFAVLLPVRTVGVMGDNRTYESAVALRAVNASDGMTASVTHLPMDFLTRVADRIVRGVPGVNRVTFDVTSKPPGTIEWE